jgi:HD superfamily phosphodiesterase
MANANPLTARLAQRRRRKAGDLHDLCKALWQGIRDAEMALEMATTVAEKCAAVHSLAAIGNTYAKVLQIGEYEARLAALEAQVAAAQGGQGHGVL